MEKLVSILEEIREQQKQQIVNYEQALDAQKQALDLHRGARRVLGFLIAAPWLILVILLAAYLLGLIQP
jgi:hypothetical protein